MRPALLFILICWLDSFPALANQHPIIRAIELRARVSDLSIVNLSVSYTIIPGRASVVEFQGFEFFSSKIREIQLIGAEDTTKITPAVAEPFRIIFSVPIEDIKNDSLWRIVINYEVATRRENKIHIPVLYPDLEPGESHQRFFTAEIKMPASFIIHDAFPAFTPEVIQQGGFTIYKYEIQAIPSMLSFQIAGDSGFPGIQRTADISLIVVITGLMILGWIKLRGSL